MKDWQALLLDSRGPSILELAEQAFSSTEKGYDLLAEKFDYTPYRTSDEILGVVAKEMEDMPMWGTALDVCCGTGAMTEVLLDNTRDRVIGLDISQGMMDKARENLSHHPAQAILEFGKGKALHLPFENEVDVVTNFGGLGHIQNKDVPKFLQQVHKTLRQGGQFIFVTSEHPSISSMAFWRAYSFNALISIRNLLKSPPFVMYYLTFLLPKVKAQLEKQGFKVEIRENLFSHPFQSFKLVIATKN